jgi:hypothetical protein
MERSRRLISLALFAAAISFPSAAQAEFCGIAGQSPQEIAVNVAKTRKFKRIGGNVRYVAYSNEAAMVTLTATTPSKGLILPSPAAMPSRRTAIGWFLPKPDVRRARAPAKQ